MCLLRGRGALLFGLIAVVVFPIAPLAGRGACAEGGEDAFARCEVLLREKGLDVLEPYLVVFVRSAEERAYETLERGLDAGASREECLAALRILGRLGTGSRPDVLAQYLLLFDEKEYDKLGGPKGVVFVPPGPRLMLSSPEDLFPAISALQRRGREAVPFLLCVARQKELPGTFGLHFVDRPAWEEQARRNKLARNIAVIIRHIEGEAVGVMILEKEAGDNEILNAALRLLKTRALDWGWPVFKNTVDVDAPPTPQFVSPSPVTDNQLSRPGLPVWVVAACFLLGFATAAPIFWRRRKAA